MEHGVIYNVGAMRRQIWRMVPHLSYTYSDYSRDGSAIGEQNIIVNVDTHFLLCHIWIKNKIY